MANLTDIVKSQLVYWAQVNAAAGAGALVDYAVQNGPGILTGGMAASVYTITMPANFTVPLNRRMIVLTPNAAVGDYVTYDAAASAANTVVIRGWRGAAGVGVAQDVAFQIAIRRVEMLP